MFTITDKSIAINKDVARRCFIGALIALALILSIVIAADADESWHKTWWVRPIVITPLAGAGGGFFFRFMFELGKEGTWKKIFVSLIGIIGYVIALWVGVVLGLAGTLWN